MRLTSLQELNPEIRWRVLETAESSAVLKAIDNEEAQVALLDSSEFSMQQRLYPRVAEAFQLQETLNTVWYLGSDPRSTEWRSEADDFLTVAIEDGTLERMKEAYFGNVANASRIESFTFQRAVKPTCPSGGHSLNAWPRNSDSTGVYSPLSAIRNHIGTRKQNRPQA